MPSCRPADDTRREATYTSPGGLLLRHPHFEQTTCDKLLVAEKKKKSGVRWRRIDHTSACTPGLSSSLLVVLIPAAWCTQSQPSTLSLNLIDGVTAADTRQLSTQFSPTLVPTLAAFLEQPPWCSTDTGTQVHRYTSAYCRHLILHTQGFCRLSPSVVPTIKDLVTTSAMCVGEDHPVFEYLHGQILFTFV